MHTKVMARTRKSGGRTLAHTKTRTSNSHCGNYVELTACRLYNYIIMFWWTSCTYKIHAACI